MSKKSKLVLINKQTQVTFLHLFLLVFPFLIFSCDKNNAKSLKSYGCFHCKKFIDNKIEFEPKLYPTKNLKTLGTQSLRSDAPNYDKLAEIRFKNKESIQAVHLSKVDKFIDNIYCLIGLDLDTYKKLLPHDEGEVEQMKDSTLLFSIIVDTMTKNRDGELVWAGTKSIYTKVKEVNGRYIIVGTDMQRYLYDICISRAN